MEIEVSFWCADDNDCPNPSVLKVIGDDDDGMDDEFG
jgi:hypothetical protein